MQPKPTDTFYYISGHYAVLDNYVYTRVVAGNRFYYPYCSDSVLRIQHSKEGYIIANPSDEDLVILTLAVNSIVEVNSEIVSTDIKRQLMCYTNFM